MKHICANGLIEYTLVEAFKKPTWRNVLRHVASVLVNWALLVAQAELAEDGRDVVPGAGHHLPLTGQVATSGGEEGGYALPFPNF